MRFKESLERLKGLGVTVNLEREDGSKIEPYSSNGSKMDRLNYYQLEYSKPHKGDTVNDKWTFVLDVCFFVVRV